MSNGSPAPRLLHFEDSAADAELVQAKLIDHGLRFETVHVSRRDAFEAELTRSRFDLILLDYNVPGSSLATALASARRHQPEAPVIIVSGSIIEDEAVRCLRAGATDYLLKDRLERLGPAVVRALEEAEVSRQRKEAERQRQHAEGEIREREALLAMAGRIAAFGGWMADLANDCVHWSNEVCAIHEMPPGSTFTLAEALGFYAPEYRERVKSILENCLATGGGFNEELEIVTASGRRVWIAVIGEAVREPSGDIQRIQGACQDITQRVEAFAAARHLADRLTATLESITDGFVTLDRSWRIVYLNRAGERVLQRSREELLGKIVWEEFPAAAGTIFEEQYTRALRDNTTVSFESYYADLESWLAVTAYPSTEGLAIYFRDVTAQKRAQEALLDSERRYRALFDANPNPMWVYDRETLRFVMVNDMAVAHYGYSREEFLAMTIKDIRPIDDVPALLDEVFKREPVVDSTREWRHRRKDGQILIVEVRSHSFTYMGRDAEMVVALDVTARRAAENAARESQERFRELAEHLHEVFYNMDCRLQRIVYVSPAYERIWQRSCESLYENPLSYMDASHPEDRHIVQEAFEKHLHGKETETEYRIILPDGNIRWIRDNAYPLKDESGTVIRVVGTARDVTERKLTHLRNLEQASLLDKAKDAIWVAELDDRVRYWNKSAERVYEWSAAEAVGKRIDELIYQERSAFAAARKELYASGEWSGELQHVTKSGIALTVECNWTLVRDDTGTANAILSINTDVTERKKLEQQFLRAQRLESIGTLAGGIAHDLNNLLGPIVMGVGLLKLQGAAPGSLRVIDTMERSARRGTDLVKQVLSFARGVEGERMPVHVRHLVTEIEGMVASTFPKNILLEIELNAGLWPVLGDATQINQILLNLCVNARDAMPNGGTLSIAAHNQVIDSHYAAMNRDIEAGRYVVIEVSDTGHGMPREIIDRIFEPFFTTKPLGVGTGLGLSTVVAIARSHGGTIDVYSEVGKGTVFRVHLPALADGAAEESSASGAVPLRGDGELILVVDDESSILTITRETLEACNYRVQIAEDGAQAIALFAQQSQTVAAIVTDMMMPIMDGAALISAVRRINSTVPIIAASGLNANADVAAAKSSASEFLAKPYRAEALLSALGRVLKKGTNG